MFRLRQRCVASLASSLYVRFVSSGNGSDQMRPPQEPRLARVFALELNQARSDFTQCPSPAIRAATLKSIEATPLSTLSQCDCKMIALIVSTLAAIGAPRTQKMIDDCAIWIAQHKDEISAQSLAVIVHSLRQLQYQRYPELLTVLLPSAIKHLPEMQLSAVAMLVSAYSADPQRHEKVIAIAVLRIEALLPTATPNDLVVLAPALQSCGSVGAELLRIVLGRVGDSITSATVGDCVPFAESICASGDNAETCQKVVRHIISQKAEMTPKLLSRMLNISASATQSDLKQLLDESLLPMAMDLIERCSNAEMGMILDGCSQRGEVTAKEVIEAALKRTERPDEEWTDVGLRAIASLIERAPKYASQALRFLEAYVDQLTNADKPVEAALLSALVTSPVVNSFGGKIQQLVLKSVTNWHANDHSVMMAAVSSIETEGMRNFARELASHVIRDVPSASAITLSSLCSSYGRLHVRHDALCSAVSSRSAELQNQLSVGEIADILGGFAAVDFRNSKAFNDLLPRTRALVHTATGPQVSALVSSYARMAVWNYKLYARLADRALEVRHDLSLHDVVALLLSFDRIDFHHEKLFQAFLARVNANVETCGTNDAIQLISAFSKVKVWDAALFDSIGSRLIECQATLTARNIGDALMAFARVELRSHRIFEELSLRALNLAPTCPPMPLANIITAYAAVRCVQQELFAILAERAMSLKDECPAITVSAVLIAFATVNIRNDRLFIEMIPRVRFVAHHGGPQDVANVLTAYTTVNLWHYKLFVRMATRAIALRGEFRGPQIAQVLSAFAKVEMRNEKLFTEFSPRIQSIVQTLSPRDIAAIAHSYATVKMNDTALLPLLAERAVALKDVFEETEGKQLYLALKKIGHASQQFLTDFAKFAPPVEPAEQIDDATALKEDEQARNSENAEVSTESSDEKIDVSARDALEDQIEAHDAIVDELMQQEETASAASEGDYQQLQQEQNEEATEKPDGE